MLWYSNGFGIRTFERNARPYEAQALEKRSNVVHVKQFRTNTL